MDNAASPRGWGSGRRRGRLQARERKAEKPCIYWCAEVYEAVPGVLRLRFNLKTAE